MLGNLCGVLSEMAAEKMLGMQSPGVRPGKGLCAILRTPVGIPWGATKVVHTGESHSHIRMII